jgi:hypothetical protein
LQQDAAAEADQAVLAATQTAKLKRFTYRKLCNPPRIIYWLIENRFLYSGNERKLSEYAFPKDLMPPVNSFRQAPPDTTSFD